MKPKTKNQKEVVELSRHLSKLSDSVANWADNVCFNHYAYATKSNWWCTECGHVHKGEIKGGYVICPNCGKRLKVKHGLTRKDDTHGWYATLRTFKGWQVYRLYLVFRVARKGENTTYEHFEVQQRWMKPNKNTVTMELPCLMQGRYTCTPYNLNGDMRLKEHARVPIGYLPIHPDRSYLPEYSKYGIGNQFHDMCPIDIMQTVTADSRAETLWKRGDYELFRYFFYNGYDGKINDYWDSLKICFRNKYKIEDVGLWRDMVYDLRQLGLDTHNAKYVCPKDLKKAHDYYGTLLENKRRKEEIERAMAKNKEYVERVSPYLNLMFKSGNISIFVLPTIKDIKHEGDTLHHCVFKNAYYDVETSLLFTARVNGVITETIEYDINRKCVLQCQGDHNKNSKYHKRILKLFNDNIDNISKIRVA